MSHDMMGLLLPRPLNKSSSPSESSPNKDRNSSRSDLTLSCITSRPSSSCTPAGTGFRRANSRRARRLFSAAAYSMRTRLNHSENGSFTVSLN